MIDIIFILVIGAIFFWDLIEFKKNQNVKIHRLLIPVGILGSFVYIYLDKFSNLEEFLSVVHDSLLSLIVSILAFVIILAIKLFLSKSEIKEEEEKFNFNELFRLLEEIKNSNKNENHLKEIQKEIIKIKEQKSYDSKEINEIKETLNTLTIQFDNDVKRFQEESIAIKGNSIKQIEVVVRLLSKQTNILEEKIEYFESKLTKIEHKKITIDDDLIYSFSKNIELAMSKIEIDLDTIKRSMDSLYDKEKNFEVVMNTIEERLHSLNEKIEKFNQVFDKDEKIEYLSNINNEFKYVLDGFAELKNDFILSLHKININSNMVNEAKDEIFQNMQKSFDLVEEKLVEITKSYFDNLEEKNKKSKSPREIAISKYNNSLEE